jgi:hypothetical protein
MVPGMVGEVLDVGPFGDGCLEHVGWEFPAIADACRDGEDFDPFGRGRQLELPWVGLSVIENPSICFKGFLWLYPISIKAEGQQGRCSALRDRVN